MKTTINIPQVFSVREISGGRLILQAEPSTRRAATVQKEVMDALVEYGLCELFVPEHPESTKPGGLYVRWGRPYEIVAFLKEQGLQP